MKKFNISKLFNNDKFLKLFSIISAIIVWFIISLVINPEISTSIKDIPLTINMQGTAAGALGLDVVSGQDQKVSAFVEGKRYIVGNLKPDDFVATVNLVSVTQPGEYELDVSITKKEDTPGYKVSDVSPTTIKLNFDRIVSKELEVEAQAPNLKVKDGFIMQQAYVTQDKIKISGPENAIDRISKVVVKTNADEIIDKTFITQGHIEYYDKDNILISSNNIITQPNNLEITVPVYKKQIVKLTFGYSNIPADFLLDKLSYTMSVEEIEIASPTDAKSNITEIHLGNVDFKKLDIDSTFSFDVVLPSGYININNIKTVDIKFDGKYYASKLLNISNFNIINKPSDYDVSVNTKVVNIKVIAPKNIISDITSSDIVAVVDLSEVNVKHGQFSVNLKISVQNKNDSWVTGEYNVIVSAVSK